MALGITIKLGATENTLTTEDGTVIDRLPLTKAEENKLRRLTTAAYRISQQKGVKVA